MKSPKTDDLIALICKAATEKYSSGPNGDRVRPGIQIAHIPAEPDCISFDIEPHPLDLARLVGRMANPKPLLRAAVSPGKPAFWYVALHRYPNPNPLRAQLNPIVAERMKENPYRVIAFTAKHEDLDRAVQLLALQLLPVEAQAELAEAIRGVKP